VHTGVITKLTSSERTEAETVYQSIKQKPDINAGNAAIGFWIQGRPLLATWLMGKVCQDDPGNIDHINNYAAMLTMSGAEQAALPILQNLNKRFPKNSTLLNNLGQAWFGLGDTDKALRYLDSAILIYAYHSQANYTKSLIAENKGNTAAAVEALIRSIKKSHSMDKENKLKKLGKKLSGKDVDFPFPMPQDPLGLEKFAWPAYPLSINESRLQELAWDAFKEDCNAQLKTLSSQSVQLEKTAMEAMQNRTTALLKASHPGKPFSPLPWYAPIAVLKLNYLVDDKDGSLEHRMKRNGQLFADAVLNDAKLQELKNVAEKQIEDKYDPLIGEGRPNPLAEYCDAINKVRSKYLLETNSHGMMVHKTILEVERKLINDQVYYAQYINWPEEFEVIKVQAKIKWLNLIKNQQVKFQPKGPFCQAADTTLKAPLTKLKAFDEVACKYHSSIDLHVMEFNNDCSRFEGKLKLGFVNYTRKIDSDNHDQLLAASLEIQVSAGKSWEKGPVQAEAKAAITGKLEWNDKGVTNWEVNAEVGVSAGSNLGHGDKSIDIAGAKAQIGMNSGPSVTGKGLLQNINITGK
jgi:tetratricopeptide (TPR) repeat protein